jgi:hypothetical protein
MSKTDDGGPAFAAGTDKTFDFEGEPLGRGMSLRDAFAMSAPITPGCPWDKGDVCAMTGCPGAWPKKSDPTRREPPLTWLATLYQVALAIFAVAAFYNDKPSDAYATGALVLGAMIALSHREPPR